MSVNFYTFGIKNILSYQYIYLSNILKTQAWKYVTTFFLHRPSNRKKNFLQHVNKLKNKFILIKKIKFQKKNVFLTIH